MFKNQTFQRLKKPLQLTVTVLVIFLLGRFLSSNWTDFEVIFTIGWGRFSLLILILLFHFFMTASRFRCIYRAIGARMGYLESFALYMSTGLLNFILPAQSGSAARAVYLKERYGMPYSQAPSVLLGGLVITFFVGGILMLLTNLVYWLGGTPPPPILWLLGLSFTASLVFLWVRFPQSVTKRLGRAGKMLELFFEGIRRLRSHPRDFIEASFWQLGEFFFTGLGFWLAFNSLNVLRFDLLAGISFAVFASLLNTVFITPGNIGILEIAIGYISQIYDFTFIQGVSATALVHGGGYLIYYLIAPIAWYFLFYRKDKIQGEKTDARKGKEN
jgi:uncharacterized membrane protein YbhN (UPF0104 family)